MKTEFSDIRALAFDHYGTLFNKQALVGSLDELATATGT
jgi:hypothetical protein